jgi:hypothetical protein
MLTWRSSLSCAGGSLMLALLLTVLAALPSAPKPSAAFAQAAGSGQTAPMLPCALIADPSTQACIASNYMYCSDGSAVSIDQGCPAGTVRVLPVTSTGYCPDGSMVPLSQFCPTSFGTSVTVAFAIPSACPDGSIAPLSQTCPTPSTASLRGDEDAR